MTLLQAMERTDWQLTISSVLVDGRVRSFAEHMADAQNRLDGLPTRVICEVCDNEFCCGHFVVVRDERRESVYVDVGPVCARDIERGIKP